MRDAFGVNFTRLHTFISIGTGSQVLPRVNELAFQRAHIGSVTLKLYGLSGSSGSEKVLSHVCPDSELPRGLVGGAKAFTSSAPSHVPLP